MIGIEGEPFVTLDGIMLSSSLDSHLALVGRIRLRSVPYRNASMSPATYTAILPIALLFIVFLLKLFIGRAYNILEIWRAAMEVPVAISIFGVSTLISFIMLLGNGGSLSEPLFLLLAFIALKIFTIVVWRQSISSLEKGNLGVPKMMFIALGTGINFFITIMMAVFSVSLLVGKQNVG